MDWVLMRMFGVLSAVGLVTAACSGSDGAATSATEGDPKGQCPEFFICPSGDCPDGEGCVEDLGECEAGTCDCVMDDPSMCCAGGGWPPCDDEPPGPPGD